MRGLLRARWERTQETEDSVSSKGSVAQQPSESIKKNNDEASDSEVESSVIHSSEPNSEQDLQVEKKAKVLVLDDDSIVLNVVGSIVTEAGGVPVMAPNGVVAMDLIAKEDGIKLVILDLHMPEMNGLTFLKGVRRIGALPNVPVVVLTGRPDTDVLEEMKPLGVEGCIIKPFQPDEFQEVIENYINLSQIEVEDC